MVADGSSPISAESTFRELDDVFLQTQTRIWLAEVLNMRLNEQLHISDLLADGDLLYEVSKVIWNMLLAKCPELRHLKYKPLDSRKSGGRYRPYSNVDSFLKICKILGLNGIDFFSPSDVVEKRNIRKVCICIRTLSKKSRSKHLKVPDFDMVTYTIAMPKNMVRGIRRSLETSQCSFSSSSSYDSYKSQRQKVRQKNLSEAGDKNYDSCSEESDEAESTYMGEESYCSSTDNVNYTATLNSDCENSPGVCSAVTMKQKEMYDNEAEGNYISDYLAFSDSIICGTDGNSPVLLEGEDNIFNFFMGIDSHSPKSGQHSVNGCGNKFSDDIEDLEVSSTASMSSLLGRALNLEFDDHLDIDGSLNVDVHDEFLDNEGCGQDISSLKFPKSQDVADESSVNQSSIVPSNSYEALEEKHPHIPVNDSDDASIPRCNESPNEFDINRRDINLAENVSNDKEKTNAGVSKDKVHRRPFLHTVARGTAIFGALFLLLHLSRRDREENSEANRKPPQNKKFKGRDIYYREGQNGGRDGIYPAGKLKFKN